MAKPTLGYPSLTAACEALQAEGLSVDEIAARVERKRIDVWALLGAARHRSTERGVTLSWKQLRALDAEASTRGVTANELAAQLIATIVADDLFEALLGEPEGGHA